MYSPFKRTLMLLDDVEGEKGAVNKESKEQAAEAAESRKTGHPPMSDLVPSTPDIQNAKDTLGLGDRLKKAEKEKKKPENQRGLSDDELEEVESTKDEEPEPEPETEEKGEDDEEEVDYATENEKLRKQMEATARMKMSEFGLDEFGFPSGQTQDQEISGKWKDGKFVADNPEHQPIVDRQLSQGKPPERRTQPQQPESAQFFEGAPQEDESTIKTAKIDLSDEQFDKITSNKTEFMKFMNQYGQKLLEYVDINVQRVTEPRLLQAQNQRAQALFAVQEFYGENPDLKPYKSVLALKARELQTKNPSWNMPKILEETEKAVRADLGLRKSNGTTSQKGGRKGGAFAGGGIQGRRTTRPGGRHADNPVAQGLAELDTEGKFFK